MATAAQLVVGIWNVGTSVTVVLTIPHLTAMLDEVLANFLCQFSNVQLHQWDVMLLHVLHDELCPARHVEVGYLRLNVVKVARLFEVLLHSICEVFYSSVRQLPYEACL